MLKFTFVFFLILNSAFAELIVWQPEGQIQNWLLYKAPNESPSESVQKFLIANQNHAELSLFTKKLKLSQNDKIRTVSHSESTLLIANSHSDHSVEAKRLREVISRFQDMKMSTLAIPVGALQRLNEIHRKQFLNEINLQFQLLVALGGDDVHPEHYSEKITWAKQLKTQRDALEIELIQNYFKNSTGRILGFCRGLQITSVALGYKLNQDLIRDLHTELPHNDGAFHSIKILPTKMGLVSQIFSLQNSIEVNSYHHQSVRLDSVLQDGYLQVAAQSSDGVIEALEGRDGRVLLFQFHPEMSDLYDRLGHQVFEYFKRVQKSLKSPSLCRKAMGA
jgi:putative glutamine amidotransferase